MEVVNTSTTVDPVNMYNNLNNFITNPTVIIIIFLIIVAFFVLSSSNSSSLGNNSFNIKDKIGNIKDKTIFIRGDKNIKYGDIMIIIDVLNRAGYKKTILITNP